MPRSLRGSSAHRSATARVRASSRLASCSLSLASPASRQISSAISCICLPDLRKPSALPRAGAGADVAQGGRARAGPVAGPRRARRRWGRRGGRRSAPRWSAPSTGRPPGDAGHPRGVRRGAGPPVARARAEPVGDQLDDQVVPGHQASSHGVERRQRRGRRGAGSRPRPARRTARAAPARHRPRGGAPAGRAVATGRPRSPARWVAETIRHSAAQPALPLARNVTRALPALLGRQVAGPPAARRRTTRGRRHLAGRATPVAMVGATARSTPSTGRMPARHGRRGRTSPRRRCRRDR